ncbi:MAG: alpha/beta hydrolase, partial [Acidobacteria bacterium]|nr:alpha/beta hydrolase [Acidobacteriota bacterium]
LDWLTRDAAEVDAYIADPLCNTPLTTQAWVDLLDGKATLGSASLLQRMPKALPIHLIAGSCDPVGENGRGLQRLLTSLQAASLTRVSMRLYPGARHELLNEINRDEVMADLIGWLEQT